MSLCVSCMHGSTSPFREPQTLPNVLLSGGGSRAPSWGLMRQSARLAARGLRKCMQLSQPGVQEHLLAAAFGEPLAP